MAESANIIDTGKYQYDKTKFRDSEGKARFSKGVGDAVSKAILGADRDALVAIVKANGLEAKFKELAKHDNLGVFRMSLGNSLRAIVRKGTAVTVRGHKITDLKQDVALMRGVEIEGVVKAGAKSAPKAKKAKAVKKTKTAKKKTAKKAAAS